MNDSNVDWGQGLIALRDEMERRGIKRIHLSYHGTTDPAVYGIDYVPYLADAGAGERVDRGEQLLLRGPVATDDDAAGPHARGSASTSTCSGTESPTPAPRDACISSIYPGAAKSGTLPARPRDGRCRHPASRVRSRAT